MQRKYIVEITAEGMIKTFIDSDGKEYKEEWHRTSYGSACGIGIESQLEQNEDFEEEELLEVLEDGDIDEIWKYLEQNN